MKNKIIALSVLLSILSGGCVNMQQSKDLLTIDVTKDYPQKEFEGNLLKSEIIFRW